MQQGFRTMPQQLACIKQPHRVSLPYILRTTGLVSSLGLTRRQAPTRSQVVATATWTTLSWRIRWTWACFASPPATRAGSCTSLQRCATTPLSFHGRVFLWPTGWARLLVFGALGFPREMPCFFPHTPWSRVVSVGFDSECGSVGKMGYGDGSK